MTSAERDMVRLVRDLEARNAALVRKNAHLEGLHRAACAKRQKAIDEARFLHGVLIAAGVRMPPR